METTNFTMEAMIERRADPTTSDELAAMHSDAFGWALACCGRDRTFAEEVLQNAYLKVLCGEARFDGRSSFKTWLFAVIRRTAAAERRREWMTGRGLLRFSLLRPTPAPAPDPALGAVASEQVRALVVALGKISKRQHEVLHLVFYQGMTIEDAARVIGVTVGSARVHYERGKSRLRALLPAEDFR